MEEMIDILDSAGNFTGKICSRTEIHQKGFWHRTVHIWAFDESGKILFQKRSLEKENHPGLLDTSCAGHIEASDSSRNAGVRELSEELGILKNAEELEFLFESKHENVLCNGKYLDNEFYDVYRIILSKTDIQKLSPQKGEVESFHWFSVQELKIALKNTPEKFVPHEKDFQFLLSLPY